MADELMSLWTPDGGSEPVVQVLRQEVAFRFLVLFRTSAETNFLLNEGKHDLEAVSDLNVIANEHKVKKK